MPTNDAIAAKAYEMWEAAGQPHGRDQEFWHAAVAATRRLRAHLDTAARDQISGWCIDQDDPSFKPVIDLLDNGVMVASVEASRHRPDLERAKISGGLAAYKIELSGISWANGPRRFELQSSGKTLPIAAGELEKLRALQEVMS